MNTYEAFEFERALLSYMLSLRRGGLPVVLAETLLQEFIEDLAAFAGHFSGDPRSIWLWALRLPGGHYTSEPYRLCFVIHQSYRVMVGAWSYGYHPDWLCFPPSPALGAPGFAAYDRVGRRVV